MNKTMLFSPLYLFFIMLLLVDLIGKSNSFSIKLIHPHSPKSPLFQPNLTRLEIIRRFHWRPRTYGQSSATFPSSNTLYETKVIRPVLENVRMGYITKLNLGTFLDERPSYKTYYFHFDTGSELTWLQCEDCAKPEGLCSPQLEAPYPNSNSITYNRLPCERHPLCLPGECVGQSCAYHVRYDEGSYSIGTLAYETFTFPSPDTHQARTARIVVGCGFYNKFEVQDEYSKEAGILGMAWGPRSLVSQISVHSHDRFSYCLPPLMYDGHQQSSAVLRFGSDIPTPPRLHTLRLLRYEYSTGYHVTLHDISINNRMLNIPSKYFASRGPDAGGCIFDTGTTYTFISRPAYEILEEAMRQNLAEADTSLILEGRNENFDLCYSRNQPFKRFMNLPTITFHFAKGADLVLQRDIAFVWWRENDKEHVCLGIKSTSDKDGVSIIGAQSQANHVFVYDLPARKIYFGPRDCARNP